jgi:hypothetical protein
VAVVLLLASVGTASTACTWLLWQEDQKNVPGLEFRKGCGTPLAYPDRTACVSVIAQRVKAWKEGQSRNQEVRPVSSGTRTFLRTIEMQVPDSVLMLGDPQVMQYHPWLFRAVTPIARRPDSR